MGTSMNNCKRFATRLTLMSYFAALALVAQTSMAQVAPDPGGTILNGRSTDPQFNPPFIGFLFEPEVPLNSLKNVPTWNEIEQLLDNPYLAALCSSLTAAPPLVQNTPGTTGNANIPGSPTAVFYPAYCSSNGLLRRPGFGVTLPPLLLHPLNYNPTDGEEMRLLNPRFPARTWRAPDQLVQCSSAAGAAIPRCGGTITVNNGFGVPFTTGPFDVARWVWTYKSVPVTAGAGRIPPGEAEIDYNAPLGSDVVFGSNNPANPNFTNPNLLSALEIATHCIIQTEVVPPESSTICGGDTGEPNFAGFGVFAPNGYSMPAVPFSTPTNIPAFAPLFAPGRTFPEAIGGIILPRNASGMFGLRKPSLRVATAGGTSTNPNYLRNRTNGGPVALDPAALTPSNENDYVRDRTLAAVLGKALFWDQQVGSDGVQACGSCHTHAGADNRTKNQINPNHLGNEGFGATFDVEPANAELVRSDFPFQKLTDPDVAGDPKCEKKLTATVNGGVLENTPEVATVSGSAAIGVTITVCDATNVIPGKNNANPGGVANDVASSMGVHFGRFRDIPPIGTLVGQSFGLASNGVRALLPDLRSLNPGENIDPIAGFAGTDGSGHQFRRVEPRNTPTVFAAALNFDNFWDGRARHDANGGSVFGAADPQSHVFVNNPGNGNLVPTRQIIRFSSLGSLATGPGLSEFEMSFQGRNWSKIGKKFLQGNGAQANRVTPLANQLVSNTDSVLGPYSNQNGAACGGLPLADRSPGTPGAGKPGLCISYPGLIRRAFYPALHQNTGWHLNGCYTDGNAPLHPNQCGTTVGTTTYPPSPADPFDGFVLSIAGGPASATDTNQFTQMEGNFSLFWGLSIEVWASLLMPDNSPYDQFLDANPDMFESIGEVGEPGLTGPMPNCSGPNAATQSHCFREVAGSNFKRDSSGLGIPGQPPCTFPAGGEGTTGTQTIDCLGSRDPTSNAPDPLLGMDIFEGQNFSLKNPNFRSGRCGECHAGATLTDNTMPFTLKAQLGDFIGEFTTPGTEALVEPLGRTRVITGFLLESEFGENGQDAVERRMINQSIVPERTNGIAYPDGLKDPIFPGTNIGAGQSFFDNGVYNLGVTRCEADQSNITGECDDIGRGGNDAFGWPLSLAALLMKNLGGHNDGSADPSCTAPVDCVTEPGVALKTFDPTLGVNGGLFDETAQDANINPGEGDDAPHQLPAYLGPWANKINVGDSMPELDEVFGGINTRTDVAILEGFVDTLGPFNPAGVLNESYNNGESEQMGTWPIVNRVARMGSFKAPQLREVGLTGPYFHNGGKLTLRQVVDFYARGGDFPITNEEHRDFNIINQNIEKQSNLTEAEKVALVDFLLELTDERVRFERGPFDHPQAILPLDGAAFEPSATAGRDAMLVGCSTTDPATALAPGSQVCAGGAFLDVPAVGSAGNLTGPLPNFLGISDVRLVGPLANCGEAANSQYCH